MPPTGITTLRTCSISENVNLKEAEQLVSAEILSTFSYLRAWTCCSDCNPGRPQGGTLDPLILIVTQGPSTDEETGRTTDHPPPSPSFSPWSEFTNSKANGSRVPKFNLINTLCGDLQQPNVLLVDRRSLSSAYGTVLEVFF